VRLGGGVDITEEAARAGVGDPGRRVDGDLPHACHVEREAAGDHAGAGDVVATALDAEQQPVLGGEPDRRRDTGRGGRLCHQRRAAGDHAVPQQHGFVPAGITGPQHRAVHAGGEPGEVVGRQDDR
jgi:hypothetical protein